MLQRVYKWQGEVLPVYKKVQGEHREQQGLAMVGLEDSRADFCSLSLPLLPFLRSHTLAVRYTLLQFYDGTW